MKKKQVFRTVATLRKPVQHCQRGSLATAVVRKGCRVPFASQVPRFHRVRSKAQTCFEGPFGEVIRATGSMAKANSFRFSTKYQDDETDLLYYGYRYYNASIGSWLSRDKIEEHGGKNLYAFVKSNPISNFDPTGLLTVTRQFPWTSSDCGSYSVSFQFRLDQKAPCDGYFVQKIELRDRAHAPCSSPTMNKTTVFYEALLPMIPAGTLFANTVDNAILIIPSNTWGFNSSVGEVQFFCASVTGDLPEKWKTGGAPESRDAPSTHDRPGWWDNPNTPPVEGPATRSVSTWWNCCCGSKVRSGPLIINP